MREPRDNDAHATGTEDDNDSPAVGLLRLNVLPERLVEEPPHVSYGDESVCNAFRSRVGWLGLFLVGLWSAAFIIDAFEHTLQANVELAHFVPLIIGQGGNAGSQAVSSVIRGLAGKEIDVHSKPTGWVVAKESAVGALCGLVLGTLVQILLRQVQILLCQVQILLRQAWPCAVCARRLVPKGPLPQEMVERVLLSPDLSGVIFSQLCTSLDPSVAVAFSSASSELWALTHVQRQQLKSDYNVAAALSLKLGMQSCKQLREAKNLCVISCADLLSEDDLATFGTLGSLLPALDTLILSGLNRISNAPFGLNERAAGHDGVQRLAEKLGAGSLPALTVVSLNYMHMGDAGASALAAALHRGALPRLEVLGLNNAAIGDAGVVALAPALRRLPFLTTLCLIGNRLLGDEGAAALLAPPPPPAGAPPTGALTKLFAVGLNKTQITDTGCAALAAAIRSGALPALFDLFLDQGTLASAASRAAVFEALVSHRGPSPFDHVYR